MTSLISLDHELKAVKSKLDEKVYECKREQLGKDFLEIGEDELVMEKAIKDAASTFEVVRNETQSIRALKSQLDEVKEGLGKEVAKSHAQLKEALYKMKISKSCSPSVHKFNAIMLEKKVDGSEMQLEMGLKKLRKIEVFEKELETATTDLLSVLSIYQKRCVDRILMSPTPSKQDFEGRLPTKQSAQIQVIVESIRHLREENEKLKADLESMVGSNTSRLQDPAVAQELENEISQLKLQVFELQNEAEEREKAMSLQRILEASSKHNAPELEAGKAQVAKYNDPSGMRADELKIDSAHEKPEAPKIEPADNQIDDSNDAPVQEITDSSDTSTDEHPANLSFVDALSEVEDYDAKSADERANDKIVKAKDEEDSYGFEDMYPSPVPMPKRMVEMENRYAELELRDMRDIKLVQPDYEQLVMDQMRHEEELEEYAVKILTLKETISELEEENRQLKGQIAFAEGEDASAGEISQLESEVQMWRQRYEESASGSSQVHRLRVELERTKAKSKKRIAVLQEDLQTLQKNGSDRIKNLIQKFKTFQEEGAARVQTLEAELEKSRAEINRLKNGQDSDTVSESDSSDNGRDDSEVDETEEAEVSSQSPECAGEVTADGVDESGQAQPEYDGDKVDSQIEDSRILREKLQTMKKAMDDAERRASDEIKHLRETIATMKVEKEMKQGVISHLQEQLNSTEKALAKQTISVSFPKVYSYGSFDDSDTDYSGTGPCSI